MPPQLEQVRRTKRAAAGDVLSCAFHHDLLAAYLFPSDTRQPEALAWLFRCLSLYGQHYGAMLLTPPTVRGAAIWVPSEAPRPLSERC